MAGIQFTTTLVGATAAISKLRELDRKTSATITKKATRAGLAPQLRAAKSSTRYIQRTGNLRRRMGVSVRSKRGGIVVAGKVLARKGARYAIPLEYGHRIAAGDSGRSEKNVVLRRRDGKPKRVDQIYGTSSGRVDPRPFMSDAFRQSVRQAESEFTSSFVRQVNQVATSG